MKTATSALACMVTGALLAVGLPAVASAESAQPVPVVQYTFDELASVPAGATLANTGSGGAALDGVVANTGATVVADESGGSAVKFPGGAGSSTTAPFVTIPLGAVAAGQQDVTLAARIKLDATANNCQWPFMIGESRTKYLFATTGCGAGTYGEAVNGSVRATARRTGVLESGWHDLRLALDGGNRLYYYIDDTLVASTATQLTAADVAGTTRSGWLAKSPYGDAFFNGTIGDFAVYAEALVDIDDTWSAFTSSLAFTDGDVVKVHPDETRTLALPTAGGVVWTSSDAGVVDPLTGAVTPPAEGVATVTLTATLASGGETRSASYTLAVSRPAAGDDPYGYLMVHFIEDAGGYAEKIYFDLSRGDDPTKWDRLNAGDPILASDLGSTGIRDPYLVQHPNTGTYYLMATDLRVFGCRPFTTGGWEYDCSQHGSWPSGANLSRELVFWESDDLVNWSEPWTLPIAQPDQGMAWAPEATWDPITQRFVMYWSSKTYPTTRFPNQMASEAGAYSKVQYGFTTDFRTDYTYGGVMIDKGRNVIDTTIYQYEGRTYRVSKDNGDANVGIWMEATDAPDWWLPTTAWTTVETAIGKADYGSVEGPLMFKDTNKDVWYVYVDQYGGSSQGYRPYRVTGLETGDLDDVAFTKMSASEFDMLSTTKHGVVRPLTLDEYSGLRKADSVSSIAPVAVETTAGEAPALPETVTVSYEDARFGATQIERAVTWDAIDPSAYAAEGSFTMTGVVEGVLPDQQFSTGHADTPRAQATVTVLPPSLALETVSSTRCVAGKVHIVASIRNADDEPADITVTSPYGTKTVTGLAPGSTASVVFTTRQTTVPAGEVAVSGTSDSGGHDGEAAYAAASCG
jgi:hypothetical protein